VLKRVACHDDEVYMFAPGQFDQVPRRFQSGSAHSFAFITEHGCAHANLPVGGV
jgi:hypothetical protein